MKQALAISAAVLASLTAPSTAQAATVVGPPPSASSCNNFSFNVSIISCAGGYDGNLLQDTLTDPIGIAAVQALGGPNTGIFVEPKLDGLNANGTINFNSFLNGLTVFGIHTGKAGDPNGNATYFFSFNASNTDVIQITGRAGANNSGLSNAALLATTSAVPEPATWALMLLGFGLIGGAMRSARQRQKLTVSYG
ncbi:PEPxxWA-CTERM sorting domain-containing protein [Tsuneonella sp. HG249]